MGKVEIGIYFCVTADILTKVLQKCSLSSPHMNFVKITDFEWLPWQPKGQIFEKNYSKIIFSELEKA